MHRTAKANGLYLIGNDWEEWKDGKLWGAGRARNADGSPCSVAPAEVKAAIALRSSTTAATTSAPKPIDAATLAPHDEVRQFVIECFFPRAQPEENPLVALLDQPDAHECRHSCAPDRIQREHSPIRQSGPDMPEDIHSVFHGGVTR